MTDLINETQKINRSAANSASETRAWIKASNKLCEIGGVFDAYGLKKNWYGTVKFVKMDDDGKVNLSIRIGSGYNSVVQYNIKESLIDTVLDIPTDAIVKFSGYFVKGNMSENECLSGGLIASPDMLRESFKFQFTDVALLKNDNGKNAINRVGKEDKQEDKQEGGQLEDKSTYKEGKREGEWLFYHDNGQIGWKVNYKDDELEGEYSEYYENGKLKTKGNYKKGKREGEWIWYFDRTSIMRKSNYKDGKEEGERLRYYEDGQLMRKSNYKDGKRDGEYLSYYENGRLVRKESQIR